MTFSWSKCVRILAVAGSLLSSTASAVTPFPRLVYDASSPCPDEQAFVERTVQRTGRDRVFDPALELIASATVTSTGARGTLVVVRGRDRTTRRVEGKSCDEVVDALAFVASFAFDETRVVEPK